MDDEVKIESNKETDRIAKLLSKAIMESDEYRNYIKAYEILKADPVLYEQVNVLRRKNFSINNGSSGQYDSFAEISNLSKQLRENEIVSDFLNAEIGFARLIQDINRIIMSDIEFDCDFLN